MEVRMSPSIKELATALSKAQGEIENAKKTSENPYFKSKFADLVEVYEVIKAPLAKYGLSIVQPMEVLADGRTALATILMHSSGEWISGVTPIAADPKKAQDIASWITYMRRYALQAMIGVASEDDDGEAAMASARNPVINTPPTSKTIPAPQPVIQSSGATSSVTDKEIARLFAIAKKCNWTRPDLMEYLGGKLGLSKPEELNWMQYNRLCQYIEATPKPAGKS